MTPLAATHLSPQMVLEELGRRIVEQTQKGAVPVPPYPAVTARLRALLEKPGYRNDDIVAAIAGDQTTSAQILQVANSGAHAGRAHVSSLGSAIMRIGNDEVTRIAIGASLGVVSKTAGPLVDLRRRVWRRSLLAAHLAHDLGKLYGMPPDDMFMVALLHDFGSLVAVTVIESPATELPPGFAAELDDWEALIHRHHVQLGLLAARRWGLPQMFCEVIATHHDARPEGPHAEVVRYIQRIDALVSVIDRAVALTPEAFAHLKLADRFVDEGIVAMPKILQRMATFEPIHLKQAASAIAHRPLALGRPECAVSVPATVVHGVVKVPMQVTKAGPFGMVATTKTRFASTLVVQFRLETGVGAPIDMCVTAQLASETPDGVLLYELSPFAQNQAVNREYLAWLKQLAG